jgi:hypothetical protein
MFMYIHMTDGRAPAAGRRTPRKICQEFKFLLSS